MTQIHLEIFNWLKNEIFIQRSTVEGYEDETKTESNADVPLHPAIVEALLAWKQATPYALKMITGSLVRP